MAENNPNPPWNNFFGPAVLNWSGDLRLDIVGFLAILGEASVQSNAQVQALSIFSCLPRLIPAPQALIRTIRPERLEPVREGRVVSSHSGNSKDWLSRVASIVHAGAPAPYTISVVRVTEKKEVAEGGTDNAVHARSYGPLTWLSLLGAAMSITLIGLSIGVPHAEGGRPGDGMSLLATICISMLSCLIGIGSKWHLILPKRGEKRDVPRSDVIIWYPQGSFVIVKCSEEVQRQLYWHTEKCEYLIKSETWYRIIALVCTVLLMAGVIFLGNASTEMQLAWVGAYVLLHAAYWTVAALPAHLHWDLGGFTKTNITVEDPVVYPKPSYTQALWRAIAVTGTSKWARDFNVANNSDAWNKWLAEANRAAERGCTGEGTDTLTLPEWNASEELDAIMKAEVAQQREKSHASSLMRMENGEQGVNGHGQGPPTGSSFD